MSRGVSVDLVRDLRRARDAIRASRNEALVAVNRVVRHVEAVEADLAAAREDVGEAARRLRVEQGRRGRDRAVLADLVRLALMVGLGHYAVVEAAQVALWSVEPDDEDDEDEEGDPAWREA